MAWLWTDALAALLVEHDRVEGARVAGWVERPEAYRLPEGAEPIDLARELLEQQGESSRPTNGFSPRRRIGGGLAPSVEG